MSILSIFCFIICAVIIISAIKKDADILSPSRIFIVIWSLAIGLADLKFSRFQHQWSAYGWITLLISIASFLLGSFTIFVIYYKKKILGVSEIRKIIRNSQLDKNNFFKLILLLFCAYIISYAVVVLIVGFIPILSKHPAELRTQMTVFGFGLIVHASTFYNVFCYSLSTISKKGLSKKNSIIRCFSSNICYIFCFASKV